MVRFISFRDLRYFLDLYVMTMREVVMQHSNVEG